MKAITTVLDAQLSLVDWFKSIQPLAVLSSSRALTALGSSKTMAVKAYASVANVNHHVERRGRLIDSNV